MRRFLSICSGIEAASVAFHPLGWQALAFAEIEPFPCSLLAHHYPQVPNLGDLTRWREWSPQLLAQADVLCGGTPCQAFSVAGLRGSLSDERGNLTLTFCHLYDEIDHQRHLCGRPPAVCLWENVPGVLNTDDNAFGHFLAGLAGEDVPLTPPGARWTDAGYVRGPRRAVAWRVLDAQYFGLAQRRERVFVVASADPAFDPAAVLFELDGLRRDTPPRRGPGEGAACGFETGPSGGQFTNVAPTLDTRCKDGPIRNQLGLGLGLGLGVAERVAGVPEVANCLTRRMHKGLNTTLDEGLNTTLDEGQTPIVEVTHSLRGEGFDASEDGTGRGTPIVPELFAFSSKDHGADASQDLSPTLRAGNHAGSHANGGNPPAIAFPEFLSGTQCASAEDVSPVLQALNPTAVAYEAESEGQREESPEAIAFKPRHYRGERKDGAASDICGPLTANAEFAGDCSPHVACQEPQAYTLHGSRDGTQAVASATDTASTIRKGTGTAIQNSSITVALSFNAYQRTVGDVTSPIMAADAKKVEIGVLEPSAVCPTPSAATQWRVRRLTPEECELLQGFPIGYTLIPGTSSKKRKGEDLRDTIDYLISLGVSPAEAEVLAHSPDGPRYKALGNSWAVPVARWIARRIDACTKALSPQ